MIKCEVIRSSTAEKMLVQDYELILDGASTELSNKEYKHLLDIADIGYEYATQKDDYLDALHDAVADWVAETRRSAFHLTDEVTEIDSQNWYNETSEVKKQMDVYRGYNVIPTFFVCFGAVVLALFCISVTVLTIGFFQNSFPINPVYLLMFVIGFLGLLLTDVVAVAEWRKNQNVQE